MANLDKYLNIKYKFKSSEQFDEYMKFVGIGMLQRKAATSVSPVAILTKDGDTYTFAMKTSFKDVVFSFKLNEEFIEERADGVKVKSIVTVDGDSMLHTQTDDNGKRLVHVRTFTPEVLTVVSTADGWDGKCIRVYEVVKD